MALNPGRILTQITDQGGLRLLVFSGLFVALSGAVPYVIYRELGGHWPALDARLLSPTAIAACLALLLMYYMADGLRLFYTVRALGHHVSALSIARLVFINLLFSNITPLATGGGFAQIWYLRRQGIHLGTAIAATTLRTLLASLTIFTIAPLLIGFMKPLHDAPVSDSWVFYLGVFAALYVGFFVLALAGTRWMMTMLTGVLNILQRTGLIGEQRLRSWRFGLRRELLRFRCAMRAYFQGSPKYIALSVLFTLIFLVALFSFPALLLWLLDYRIDYFTVIGLMLVITFVMYFSPTPGASGIAEGLFAAIFAGMVGATDLLLMVIVWRALTIYLGMLIGVPVTLRVLERAGGRHA